MFARGNGVLVRAGWPVLRARVARTWPPKLLRTRIVLSKSTAVNCAASTRADAERFLAQSEVVQASSGRGMAAGARERAARAHRLLRRAREARRDEVCGRPLLPEGAVASLVVVAKLAAIGCGRARR